MLASQAYGQLQAQIEQIAELSWTSTSDTDLIASGYLKSSNCPNKKKGRIITEKGICAK